MRVTKHRVRYVEDGVCISLHTFDDNSIGNITAFVINRDKLNHKREFVPRRDLTVPVNKGVFATIKHHADSMQSAIDRKSAWDNDGRAKYQAPVMTDHKLAIDNGSKVRESTKFNTELPLMQKLKSMGVWSKEEHKKPAKPQVGGYWK